MKTLLNAWVSDVFGLLLEQGFPQQPKADSYEQMKLAPNPSKGRGQRNKHNKQSNEENEQDRFGRKKAKKKKKKSSQNRRFACMSYEIWFRKSGKV